MLSKYVLPSAKRVEKKFAVNLLAEVVAAASGSSNLEIAVRCATGVAAKEQLGSGSVKNPK